jgi:hypothetical protein
LIIHTPIVVLFERKTVRSAERTAIRPVQLGDLDDEAQSHRKYAYENTQNLGVQLHLAFSSLTLILAKKIIRRTAKNSAQTATLGAFLHDDQANDSQRAQDEHDVDDPVKSFHVKSSRAQLLV